MDTQLIRWPSPAKLNLFLHILGRREDGYHRLQSLFQLLDQGDSLQFEVTDDSQIQLVTPIPGVPDEDNLVVKAARLLQKHGKGTKGCRIYLDKKLPMGGGIGGGSSNAATTLLALDHLWQLDLGIDKLAEIGLRLGADVPVFVRGHTAFAEGVGEHLYPVSQPGLWYLVVSPGIHVATKDIFTHPDLPRNTPPLRWQDYQFESTHNDCQELVCKLHPKVAKILQWLLEYAPSRMTGTGSCLFAVFPDKVQAERLLAALPEGCRGFVAQGVNYSPVHSLLERLKRLE
ncbi:4-(cytidine 5'-diphospho)-2-C-methyl-D-erythritol kinase [Aliiglaciecola sp. CAU 1673]|uniref:4-(cytidine 5'-diphospho)-2-C-methyl-D-erythritol kinase n=1 Tax=Aliiglaciecola sp. CAU 1673 TaxID=3032595 RepID=UPI0023DAF100|nr:4-(cytidine 5'-diphospho)-2-C-methyl-D-erythritol kinase [Aliiglaciecola sp. CAU 1673]MDF2179386.1 4-(cytidine 5'-diphospho)-2-C-methyl-D-erythritol kinase [Aliiglaciecola sp. CAU 1673]